MLYNNQEHATNSFTEGFFWIVMSSYLPWFLSVPPRDKQRCLQWSRYIWGAQRARITLFFTGASQGFYFCLCFFPLPVINT